MLEFRRAAGANNLFEMERVFRQGEGYFNINEPGVSSGKTAAHVAAERGCFNAIYWLFEKGADFYCTDLAGKTPCDYLQQREFTLVGINPLLKEDRKYQLCNAH